MISAASVTRLFVGTIGGKGFVKSIAQSDVLGSLATPNGLIASDVANESKARDKTTVAAGASVQANVTANTMLCDLAPANSATRC